MKKLLIIFNLILLCGCNRISDKDKYNDYINLLNNVSESSLNIPFSINVDVKELNEDLFIYSCIIDRNNLIMNNIEAIIIHDVTTEDIFPSLGIFENKISLNDEYDKRGIKLSGYINKGNNINFKVMIKYKNEMNEEKTYYYIYNYRQDV